MIYFCFVQGDVTGVAHLAARGEAQHRAPAGQSRLQADREDRKLLLVRDKKNPRAPHHYPGADPTRLRGSRFTFIQVLGKCVQETDTYSPSLNLWVQSFSQSQQHVEPSIPFQRGKKNQERREPSVLPELNWIVLKGPHDYVKATFACMT